MVNVVLGTAGILTEPIERALGETIRVGGPPASGYYVEGPVRTAADVARCLERVATIAERPAAWVIHPDVIVGPPLRLGLGPLSRANAQRLNRALYDDVLWRDAMEGGLDMPWRWMNAALARKAESIVMLIPGETQLYASSAEESACREALVTFVRATALQLAGSERRINAVQLVAGAAPEQVAELVAFLASRRGRGAQGQVLSAR